MKTMKIILVIASIALVSTYASPAYVIRGELESAAASKTTNNDTITTETAGTTQEMTTKKVTTEQTTEKITTAQKTTQENIFT